MTPERPCDEEAGTEAKPLGRLRRAVHFVPAGHEKRFRKSLTLEADSLILDLEDAVAPDRKEAARSIVTGWLKEIHGGCQERVVRINALDTPWGRKDLECTLEGRPDAYLVPKVESPDTLREIDALLTRLERAHGFPLGNIKLLVLACETPQAVLRIRELAGCARVEALSWGAEDLSTALGARRPRDAQGHFLEVFRHARVMTLLSAAAAGVQALDTVWVDLRDREGLRRECQEAATMGFSGKLTIHPDQVPVVVEAFSPSAQEISESQELLVAFARERGAGSAVFQFQGRMVDTTHLSRARGILARARQGGRVEGPTGSEETQK